MDFPGPFGARPSYFSGGTAVPIHEDRGLDFSQPGPASSSRGPKKTKPSMKLSREEGSWRLNPIASYGIGSPPFSSTREPVYDGRKHHSAPRLGPASFESTFQYPRYGEMFSPSHIPQPSYHSSLTQDDMPRPLPAAGRNPKFTVAKPKARKSRQVEFQEGYSDVTQFSMPPPIMEFAQSSSKKGETSTRKNGSRDVSKGKIKAQAKGEIAGTTLNSRWKAVEDLHHTRLIDLISLKPGEEADFEREVVNRMSVTESQRKKRKSDVKFPVKAKRLSSLKAVNGSASESSYGPPEWSSGQNVKVVAKVRVNASPEERCRKPMSGHQDLEIFENYYGAKKRILTVLKRAKPLASLRKPDRSKLTAMLAVKKEKFESAQGSTNESLFHPAAEWGHAAFSPAGRLKGFSHDNSPFVDDFYGSFASVGSTPSHADSDLSSDPEADESRRKILAQLQKLNDKRARLEAQLTKIQKHNLGADDRSGDHSRSSSVATNLTHRDFDFINMRTAARTARPVSSRRDLFREQWKIISQICIPLCHRIRVIRREEAAMNRSQLGAGVLRDHAENRMDSERLANEYQQRAKFMVRDMFSRWKVIDKEEKKYKKLKEKEEVEQKRIDLEMQEAKRQQRKLNFLITQTELYAHFMGKKISGTDDSEAASAFDPNILKRLDETTDAVSRPQPEDSEPDLTDKLVGDKAKEDLVRTVEQAFADNQKRISKFAVGSSESEPGILETAKFDAADSKVLSEPKMFQGSLKAYQKKGISWLASLFSNGINGILADEMGLGKTVQSIAFLGHLAEEHGIWGPFLIVAPASTLHNWQQEFHRFLPNFKAVPYWGTTEERKVLRQFWKVDKMHTEQASFHVVITSYQLVVQDASYLKKIKWQYMILDEAQAIKSSASIRWKLLLDFPCRNRLLLTGTPIQNSMAELWSLLHFIMPSLFDSHSEFNEWFSRDIESHAENKSQIDEKHLSRLHMILKPFMMRRIKRDVEEELSDKIEIMVNCPLTRRQRNLYEALKHKISIEDLLYTSTSTPSQSEATSSALMNLVMQFRKVCNHPELFERRDIRTPAFLSGLEYRLPKLVYDDALRTSPSTTTEKIINKYFLLSSAWNVPREEPESSILSFCCLHSVKEHDIDMLFRRGLFEQIKLWILLQGRREKLAFCQSLSGLDRPKDILFMDYQFPFASPLARNFLMVDVETRRYSHGTCKIHYIAEEKQKKTRDDQEAFSADDSQEPEIEEPKLPRTIEFYPLHIPHFFICYVPRALSRPSVMYCYDRHAESERLLLSIRNCEVAKRQTLWFGSTDLAEQSKHNWEYLQPVPLGGIIGLRPTGSWAPMEIPDKQHLVVDSGKLRVLDSLLHRLKDEGHRVLIYSLMTKMMDILEEFMVHKRYAYIRLDGSSKIADRRDMVKNFQTREDIFVFLLSTRAGGLGINLTAADTVIFYDSDWNPTVDQQAMDRAHRLGQTKQVTVYRLICRNTVEERILERAQEKSEIQRMVISGGDYRPDTLKPTEVVSLLLDDDEIKNRLRLKEGEIKSKEELAKSRKQPRKRDPSSARLKKASKGPAIEPCTGGPVPKKKSQSKNIILPVAVSTAASSSIITPVPGSDISVSLPIDPTAFVPKKKSVQSKKTVVSVIQPSLPTSDTAATNSSSGAIVPMTKMALPESIGVSLPTTHASAKKRKLPHLSRPGTSGQSSPLVKKQANIKKLKTEQVLVTGEASAESKTVNQLGSATKTLSSGSKKKAASKSKIG